MKLILCRNCQDVIRLIDTERTCKCGNASGRYTDELNAIYSGCYAVPIGFDNNSLVKSVQRPNDGLDFKAFVIKPDCKTFKRI